MYKNRKNIGLRCIRKSSSIQSLCQRKCGQFPEKVTRVDLKRASKIIKKTLKAHSIVSQSLSKINRSKKEYTVRSNYKITI